MNEQQQQVKISPSWKPLLEAEFAQAYFADLREEVRKAYLSKQVFPHPSRMFRAFDEVAPKDVRVVILGQDPYHTPGVADGLAFSSFPDNPVPPSLANIYKEIEAEFGCSSQGLPQADEIRGMGEKTMEAYIDMTTESLGTHNDEVRRLRKSYTPDLSRWAKQGVLLLNASLTVESGLANSHVGFGWHTFTDAVIRIVSRECEHVVFLLWGNYAREKRTLIDPVKHLILESPHPSPLSAHKGFFGNGHFVQANVYLKEHDKGEILWCE